MHIEKRRNKAICIVLVVLAISLTYWSFGIGIGGFFAFLFLVTPILAIAFVYYSKVKHARYLINQMNEVEDLLSKITIRQYINTKVWNTTGVAFTAWAVGFLVVIGLVKNPLVAIISFLVFGGAVITKMFFITCPRCKAGVGPLYPIVGYANYCPGCGISFDEPVVPPKKKSINGE